jgi:hypothetical protein
MIPIHKSLKMKNLRIMPMRSTSLPELSLFRAQKAALTRKKNFCFFSTVFSLTLPQRKSISEKKNSSLPRIHQSRGFLATSDAFKMNSNKNFCCASSNKVAVTSDQGFPGFPIIFAGTNTKKLHGGGKVMNAASLDRYLLLLAVVHYIPAGKSKPVKCSSMPL